MAAFQENLNSPASGSHGPFSAAAENDPDVVWEQSRHVVLPCRALDKCATRTTTARPPRPSKVGSGPRFLKDEICQLQNLHLAWRAPTPPILLSQPSRASQPDGPLSVVMPTRTCRTCGQQPTHAVPAAIVQLSLAQVLATTPGSRGSSEGTGCQCPEDSRCRGRPN